MATPDDTRPTSSPGAASSSRIWPGPEADPLNNALSTLYQLQAISSIIDDAVMNAPVSAFEKGGRTIDVCSLTTTVELLLRKLEDEINEATFLVHRLQRAAGEGVGSPTGC